jgi:hypothetical protein
MVGVQDDLMDSEQQLKQIGGCWLAGGDKPERRL